MPSTVIPVTLDAQVNPIHGTAEERANLPMVTRTTQTFEELCLAQDHLGTLRLAVLWMQEEGNAHAFALEGTINQIDHHVRVACAEIQSIEEALAALQPKRRAA